MDTIVYIDGYNLYYGRLKHTPYKWLNPFKLFQTILKVQDPASNIIKIKYFTAPVKANFASHGQASVAAQNSYHRALKYLYGNRLDIIQGYHTVEKGNSLCYKKPIDKNNRVAIWKFEEKQTDVNIALHMYRDALNESISQQVLVSNDSDLELPLKLIKEDKPNIIIGLVTPRKKPINSPTRPPNESLSRFSNWTRHHILNEECQLAQLDEKISTLKKPILKPKHW